MMRNYYLPIESQILEKVPIPIKKIEKKTLKEIEIGEEMPFQKPYEIPERWKTK
jgi:hypothetical protein